MSKKIQAPSIREDYGWGILDRLRLVFKKDKALRRDLHKILGFWPHDIEYYHTAFAHSSVAYKSRKGRSLNNERLEFLGDAVLETVVSDIVFRHFDRSREGFLTRTRSKVVQRSTLNRLADNMGITQHLRINARPDSHHSNIGGNAFEALVGAIYLDRGYNHCFTFITRCVLKKHLDLDRLAQQEENFKSKILEWSQKNKVQFEFRPRRTENEGTNNAVFRTEVVVEGISVAQGSGYSKKESHQNAAREAMKRIQRNTKLRNGIFEERAKRLAAPKAEPAAEEEQ